MSYELNMMKAEVEALRLVKEHTSIPVPIVLFYDNSHSICNADYFIMDKIEGESFFVLKNKGLVTSEQQVAIHQKMGQINREINRIKGISFGYLGTPEKQGTDWKKIFLTMLEEVLKDGESIGISLGVDYNEVRDLIQRAAYTLEEVEEPTFVHWDMWDGNVFINNGEITGIIDFERAQWADPLMEAYFRRDNYGKDFIDGYGANLREESPIRALLYDIYLYLIMVIETKYRMYDNNWQYDYAAKQLALSMEDLKNLV
jgi:aminoglycoside phosphotransferase (APT) family kinase protein